MGCLWVHGGGPGDAQGSNYQSEVHRHAVDNRNPEEMLLVRELHDTFIVSGEVLSGIIV